MNIITFVLALGVAFIASHFGYHAESRGLMLAAFGIVSANGAIVGTGIKWPAFFEELKAAGSVDARQKLLEALAMDVRDYFQGKGAHLLTAGQKENAADPNLAGYPMVAGVWDNPAAMDMGYKQIFDNLDLTLSTTETFKLINVLNGVTFQQLKPGEKPKFYDLTSTNATVSRLIFGAAMAMLDDWFKFNQFYQAERLVTSVKRKSASQKAKFHYDLFAALSSGINDTFVTDDATTIDKSAAQIISDCKDKGYWNGDEPRFVVLAHTSLKRRLMKAIWPAAAVTGAMNLQGPVFNIQGLVLSPFVANTSYYLILPGNQIVSGTWEDLNAEPERDAGVRGTNLSYREAYNCSIGDSQQVRRCALS